MVIQSRQISAKKKAKMKSSIKPSTHANPWPMLIDVSSHFNFWNAWKKPVVRILKLPINHELNNCSISQTQKRKHFYFELYSVAFCCIQQNKNELWNLFLFLFLLNLFFQLDAFGTNVSPEKTFCNLIIVRKKDYCRIESDATELNWYKSW